MLAKNSHLKKEGQLLGYKDIPTVSSLAPAWYRQGAYKI